MDTSPRVALVAALEREVRPLVKNWARTERKYEGRIYKFFEKGGAVLVCGGIGVEAARRATRAVIALYAPAQVWSVGFAGSLDPTLKIGQVLAPACVIDAQDGSRTEVVGGSGTLVTFSSVAGSEQKAKLAQAYQAQVIDMEAAAVAKGAEQHGLLFSAVKVISDEPSFDMGFTERFIGEDGNFRTTRFVLHAALRPWLWTPMIHLARNSAEASRTLCGWLGQQLGPRSSEKAGVVTQAGQA